MRKLIAKDGYVFALKDRSEVYDNILYLGIYDSEDNYIEITIKEGEDIKREIRLKDEEEELRRREELR